MLLNKYLCDNEISQEDFARQLSDKLGHQVRQSTVSRLCSRSYEPRLRWILAIGELTEGAVSPDDLRALPRPKRAGKGGRARTS